MNLWKDLEAGPKVPDEVYAVIEIPKGSRNKYELLKKGKDTVIFLDRVLHSPVFYVGDYGIIPRTLWEDGDPMDILVLMDQPTFPGCVIPARPIAFMEMLDQGERDDKIIAVAIDDPKYKHVKEIDDIMEEIIAMKGVKRVIYEIIVDERFYPDYIYYVASKKGYKG